MEITNKYITCRVVMSNYPQLTVVLHKHSESILYPVAINSRITANKLLGGETHSVSSFVLECLI